MRIRSLQISAHSTSSQSFFFSLIFKHVIINTAVFFQEKLSFGFLNKRNGYRIDEIISFISEYRVNLHARAPIIFCQVPYLCLSAYQGVCSGPLSGGPPWSLRELLPNELRQTIFQTQKSFQKRVVSNQNWTGYRRLIAITQKSNELKIQILKITFALILILVQ